MIGLEGNMLANRSHADRKASDFYETPEDVTRALMHFLGPIERDLIFWECAAGAGRMARVLREGKNKVIESDLDREPSVDFLSCVAMPEDANFIITNPPFNLAAQFIRKAMELKPTHGFAFLLKSQFWHASSRLALFESSCPSFVLPLTWRPDFCFGERGGAPTMECLWTVWLPATARTIYQPLSKPL